jgi:hypothetical protein
MLWLRHLLTILMTILRTKYAVTWLKSSAKYEGKGTPVLYSGEYLYLADSSPSAGVILRGW